MKSTTKHFNSYEPEPLTPSVVGKSGQWEVTGGGNRAKRAKKRIAGTCVGLIRFGKTRPGKVSP